MINLSFDPNYRLPTAAELPDSDDTPVDNELQNEIPNFLLNLLRLIWAERQDWFWGVDMGIYYHPHQPAIVPDGFLALGVPRHKDINLRLSYVLWEENWTVPTLAFEVVSQKYGGEYDTKMVAYAELGILYYVIYNPLVHIKRRKYKHHQPLEVYKLIGEKYELVTVTLPHGVVWLPEINLGIGCEQGRYGGLVREWVYWYNEDEIRYLSAEELATQAEEAVTQERLARQKAEARAEHLAAQLRLLGIDPDLI